MDIAHRSGVTDAQVAQLQHDLQVVDWASLAHAYGAAADVPELLLAITVGTDAVRTQAWTQLWGNVHHQGTVYEATAPAVSFLGAIARDTSHPDRVEAIAFLREIAIGDGTCAAQVRDAVRPMATALIDGWSTEPDPIKPAVAWLGSAYPEMLTDAIHGFVPEELRQAWREMLEERRLAEAGDDEALDELYDDDDVQDRRGELEDWAHGSR